MQKFVVVLAAALVVAASARACDWHAAQAEVPVQPMVLAQSTDAARPARGPQEETSISTGAPAATPDQTTAGTDQPPKIKQMNEDEKTKIEQTGK